MFLKCLTFIASFATLENTNTNNKSIKKAKSIFVVPVDFII
jgi:hypothetical protein